MHVSTFNGALWRALNGLSCSMLEPSVSWWAWPCRRRAGTVIGGERCKEIQEARRCKGCPYWQQGKSFFHPPWEQPPYFWEFEAADENDIEWGGGADNAEGIEGEGVVLVPSARCRRLRHHEAPDGRCLTCQGRFYSGKTVTARWAKGETNVRCQ